MDHRFHVIKVTLDDKPAAGVRISILPSVGEEVSGETSAQGLYVYNFTDEQEGTGATVRVSAPVDIGEDADRDITLTSCGVECWHLRNPGFTT